MAEIVKYKHDVSWKHYDNVKLEGYIYKDVFPSILFQNIRNFIESNIEDRNTKTFLMSGTEITFNNNKIKLFQHQQNDREQIVLIDQTFNKEWYYQTPDTIKKWSDANLLENINPQILSSVKHIEKLEPFSSNEYVFNRIHINYLAPGKFLGLHRDGGMLPYKSWTDKSKLNYSVTIYLYDHVEGLGGEFWGPCGFVYKPKANSALVVNGQYAVHGVTQNVSEFPRLAFTIRASHISNLYLPGHPDKFLWDVLPSI